jgi:hypothetical protein
MQPTVWPFVRTVCKLSERPRFGHEMWKEWPNFSELIVAAEISARRFGAMRNSSSLKCAVYVPVMTMLAVENERVPFARAHRFEPITLFDVVPSRHEISLSVLA